MNTISELLSELEKTIDKTKKLAKKGYSKKLYDLIIKQVKIIDEIEYINCTLSKKNLKK